MRPPRLGVTGGIGSGKSTVIGMLAGFGAAVVDTDAIAHELTGAGGGAMPAIVAAFGSAMAAADGGLDRPRMRAAVFADAAARRRLEDLLHPRILERALDLARARAATAPLVVFDVPLLVEAQRFRQELALDRVLVIDCPPERQIAHAVARGGMDAATVAAVIAAQAGRADRLALADDVLVNAGSRPALAARVARLWSRYCPAVPPGPPAADRRAERSGGLR